MSQCIELAGKKDEDSTTSTLLGSENEFGIFVDLEKSRNAVPKIRDTYTNTRVQVLAWTTVNTLATIGIVR